MYLIYLRTSLDTLSSSSPSLQLLNPHAEPFSEDAEPVSPRSNILRKSKFCLNVAYCFHSNVFGSKCLGSLSFGSIPQSTAIVKKLNRIQDHMLRKLDPELWIHMKNLDITPQVYGL